MFIIFGRKNKTSEPAVEQDSRRGGIKIIQYITQVGYILDENLFGELMTTRARKKLSGMLILPYRNENCLDHYGNKVALTF